MAIVNNAPEEVFDYDISRGIKNAKKQMLNFETVGENMLVSITENGVTSSFEIDYKNRLCLTNIRALLGEIDTHSTKRANNVKRIEDV
jgi:hypothetical protein